MHASRWTLRVRQAALTVGWAPIRSHVVGRHALATPTRALHASQPIANKLYREPEYVPLMGREWEGPDIEDEPTIEDVEAEREGLLPVEAYTPEFAPLARRWALQETLDMGRHTKVTGGGRIFSVSATVIVGDQRGTAGFGYGKALTAASALTKATVDAEKRMCRCNCFCIISPMCFCFALPITQTRFLCQCRRIVASFEDFVSNKTAVSYICEF